MVESHRSRATGGFTLIDLAFIIAVAAIFASVVTVSQLGKTENDMAEVSVRQVLSILDAARWIQHENQIGLSTDPLVQDPFLNYTTTGSWPGQEPGTPYKCMGTLTQDKAVKALRDDKGGLLAPSHAGVTDRVLVNPWGEAYEFSLDSPEGVDPTLPMDITYAPPSHQGANAAVNCWFRVSTNVPASVAGRFRTSLPNAYCATSSAQDKYCPASADPAKAPGEGFVRCCTMIPRPGTEPRFREWIGGYPTTWCTPWATGVMNPNDATTHGICPHYF
jgi:hypothetical protein